MWRRGRHPRPRDWDWHKRVHQTAGKPDTCRNLHPRIFHSYFLNVLTAKKGSICLYFKIFTVASLGALPCEIATKRLFRLRHHRARESFLSIAWYLDGMGQCRGGMT